MVTLPLVLLAIPSVFAGLLIDPIVVGDFFRGVISVAPEHEAVRELAGEWHGVGAFIEHGLMGPAFWLAMAGLFTAWFVYMRRPALADACARRCNLIYRILVNKYGFDDFNQAVFSNGAVMLGRFLWRVGDVFLIDRLLVNGAAAVTGWLAQVTRHLQTGYLYHYGFAMILGLIGLLGWYVIV